MIPNALITAWQQRTGADAYGQPTYTDESDSLGSSGLACLAEPKHLRLDLDGRTRMTELVAHTSRYIAISVGDRVAISGVQYDVLSAQPCTHGTLGHVTLGLSPSL